MQLDDMLCGGGMSGCAATHSDAGAAKLLAHRGRREAQLRTDLAPVQPWAYKSAVRLTSTATP
jgi:hypothetical protein